MVLAAFASAWQFLIRRFGHPLLTQRKCVIAWYEFLTLLHPSINWSVSSYKFTECSLDKTSHLSDRWVFGLIWSNNCCFSYSSLKPVSCLFTKNLSFLSFCLFILPLLSSFSISRFSREIFNIFDEIDFLACNLGFGSSADCLLWGTKLIT